MDHILERKDQNPPGYKEILTYFRAIKDNNDFDHTSTYKELISDIKKMAKGELLKNHARQDVYPEWSDQDFQNLLQDLNEQ